MNMEKEEVQLVYAQDGKSLYDQFFLKHLTKEFKVHLLTFSREDEFLFEFHQIQTVGSPPLLFNIAC